jgi:hypothetical protein
MNGNDGQITTVTTDATGAPTPKPQPKVVAATVGAGVGGAITTIGVWLIETLGHVDLPVAVEGSALVLVSAALAFLGGYVKRPGATN